MIKMRYCEKCHWNQILGILILNRNVLLLLGSIECHWISTFWAGMHIWRENIYPMWKCHRRWFVPSSSSCSISQHLFSSVKKVTMRAINDWNCFINGGTGINVFKCCYFVCHQTDKLKILSCMVVIILWNTPPWAKHSRIFPPKKPIQRISSDETLNLYRFRMLVFVCVNRENATRHFTACSLWSVALKADLFKCNNLSKRFISLEEEIFFTTEISGVQVLIFGIMCNQLLCAVVLLYAFSPFHYHRWRVLFFDMVKCTPSTRTDRKRLCSCICICLVGQWLGECRTHWRQRTTHNQCIQMQ